MVQTPTAHPNAATAAAARAAVPSPALSAAPAGDTPAAHRRVQRRLRRPTVRADAGRQAGPASRPVADGPAHLRAAAADDAERAQPPAHPQPAAESEPAGGAQPAQRPRSESARAAAEPARARDRERDAARAEPRGPAPVAGRAGTGRRREHADDAAGSAEQVRGSALVVRFVNNF